MEPTADEEEAQVAAAEEPGESDLTELLIEEVSIDGMCGVY